jgi:flavin reductase (DIM6/NTAB) family NADH-FMN oxidoreductase RutF
MRQWRCKICGYIFIGEAPPERCPVCGVGPEAFVDIGAADPAEVTAGRERLQEALFQLDCGLYVVTSLLEGDPPRYNGMINNTIFQITDQPLQVLLGMDKQHLTTEYIRVSGVFAVNYLATEQMELVKRFGFHSGRQIDKLAGLAWKPGISGVPLLETAPGYLECRVEADRVLDAGTHLVFLAQVIAARTAESGIPLLGYPEYRRRKHELWTEQNG